MRRIVESSWIRSDASAVVRASGFRLKARRLIPSTAPGSSPLARAIRADGLELARRGAPGAAVGGLGRGRGGRVGGRRLPPGGRRRRAGPGRRRAPERPLGVEVEPDAQERRALLERVRGGGLQVVAERDQRLGLAVARDLGGAELHLHDALGRQLPEDQDLVVPDLVGDHLEGPRAVERLVQARDDAVALDVVEEAVPALALLDLGRVEGLLEEGTVHGGHLRS